eukprot:c7087_g2_i1.p1 GENE.c7087_g2_i1~~c7087_g2_i1.p1  ORF type:complete len:112 (-),score=5.51 c7087_g2_i1:275-610(-)
MFIWKQISCSRSFSFEKILKTTKEEGGNKGAKVGVACSLTTLPQCLALRGLCHLTLNIVFVRCVRELNQRNVLRTFHVESHSWFSSHECQWPSCEWCAELCCRINISSLAQ